MSLVISGSFFYLVLEAIRYVFIMYRTKNLITNFLIKVCFFFYLAVLLSLDRPKQFLFAGLKILSNAADRYHIQNSYIENEMQNMRL